MSWTISAFVGAGIIALAGYLAFREHLWLKSAEVVDGTVTENIISRTSKGRASYRPKVHFVAKDNSAHDFLRSYSSSPADFRVGEKVAIAYRPGTYEARILTFGQRFGFAVCLATVGFVFLLPAAAFLIGRQYVPAIYMRSSSLVTVQ